MTHIERKASDYCQNCGRQLSGGEKREGQTCTTCRDKERAAWAASEDRWPR